MQLYLASFNIYFVAADRLTAAAELSLQGLLPKSQTLSPP